MSGLAVRRAFDKVRVGGVSLAAPVLRAVPVLRPRVREMSVQAALEWAFGTECAALDFDNAASWVVGQDCVWRLMQRKALGCKVDGGGRSASHHDAEVIASFVAALPEGQGGRGMAVRIAECARAGVVPDAMVGVEPALRCRPVGLAHPNQHGRGARVEVVPALSPAGWGRDVPMCPIVFGFVPTVAQVGAARRDWLRWWGALLHIGAELRGTGVLEMIRLTQAMPPLEPWNARA